MKIITHEILRSWEACSDGYTRFCELFPDGADLKTASEGLIADGHNSWSDWLWSKCKASEDFCEQTIRAAGYYGTATAGYGGTATAGDGGTATAGDGGAISILFCDRKKGKYLRKIGAIDGENLKPGVAYRLDENGFFVEVIA